MDLRMKRVSGQGCIWELIEEVSRWTQKDWIILIWWCHIAGHPPTAFNSDTSSSAKSAYLLLLTHSMCVCLFVCIYVRAKACVWLQKINAFTCGRETNINVKGNMYLFSWWWKFAFDLAQVGSAGRLPRRLCCRLVFYFLWCLKQETC